MKNYFILFIKLVVGVQFSVSGISSGASFAHQIHVAYSSSVIGAGIISGDVYYCSMGSYARWATACSVNAFLINTPSNIQAAMNNAAQGLIDSTENLKNSNVYIFSGKLDNLISQPVVEKMLEFYENFQANATTMFNFTAQHAWITSNAGNPCWYLGSPYINNCGYDAAGAILNKLYSNLKPKTSQIPSNLLEFDQSDYTDVWLAGLSTRGWIYIPTNCQVSKCSVHFSFHGCMMYYDLISDAFIKESGLNEWAESNNIIIIYPQTRPGSYNPAGCWDVYGYTGPNFALKSSLQMSAIYAMSTKVPLVNWN